MQKPGENTMDMLKANIRALMEARGWKASDLTRESGVNPTGVYDMLSGKTKNARMDIVEKIARAFGVPVYHMLIDPERRDIEVALLAIFEHLPAEEQQRLVLTAEAWAQANERLKQPSEEEPQADRV